MRLSAVLITYNEELKLPDCLRSLDFADEIVVVDSYSTDRTAAIAKEFNARVEQRKFDDFSSQKNYALSLAQGEWALLIDADERVTSKLRASVLRAVENPGSFTAFRMARRNHIFGGVLKHGASGSDKPARLLKKGRGRFEGMVHETLKVQGETGELPGELDHFTYQTRAEYELKFPLFCALDAQKRMARGDKRPSLFTVFFRPFAEFIYYYFFRLGFLDGRPGLLYQWLSSRYIYKCCKIMRKMSAKAASN